MLFNQRPVIFASLAVCLLLASCANTSTGEALERSLASDPKLKDNSSVFSGVSQDKAQTPNLAELPQEFPAEIPRYPGAKLEKVESLEEQGKLTVWSSSDPKEEILRYYQQTFESDNWQLVTKPEEEGSEKLVALQDNLQVTFSLLADGNAKNSNSSSPLPQVKTEQGVSKFEIQYLRNGSEVVSPASEQQKAEGEDTSTDVASAPTGTSSSEKIDENELEKVSQDLRQYIENLAALGVFNSSSSAKSKTNADSLQFAPNKTLNRGEYARWLVTANNLIYANRRGAQIRLASESTQPAFQDVPRTHPNFPAIQGLAEAGIIPSPISGDSTAVLFRPDAPLTRESLILTKVPLDIRQAMPPASIDAVQKTWGFQDTTKIDPKALPAVLADFQNGDAANIRRVFGFTTLFQPKKAVTRAEAAAALWHFGSQTEGISAEEALKVKAQNSQELGLAE
ncbi:MAG: S-layer homology domain-containing protein [Coleofasciculaceae cyanobacterium]